MHIKSMVIDGFKSYGQRTVIDGFDEAFNAITGLNGSGKSNILDAICFLLGITNLSHVRATNLQELVYKNGQAGIMKATVTITFDNSDKNQSPMGYEHFNEVSITRQVVIGGKNKYLINGTNIQSNRVQDFFRSVQLNVNNPHFLIMQGRITKVLNMKPPEVLAMIEEAAGTMMYESKKQHAQKTIEKKDSKLREINVILSEEITPTLSKLKEERSTYLEYQKIQRELEHLTKLCTAYKFVIAKKSAVDEQETLDTIRTEKETAIEDIKEREVAISRIEEELQQLQQRRDRELGGHLEELESALAEKEKKVTKCEASLKETRENAKAEKRKKAQITNGMKTDQKALDDKKKTSEGMQEMFNKLRNENEECTTALKNAQKRFEAISVGKFCTEDGKGKAATLQEQVISLKSDISNAETTKKTSDMKIKHNRKEMARIEKLMMKTEAEFAKDGANLPKLQRDVEKAKAELQSLGYTPGVAEQTEEELRSTRTEVNALEKRIYDMSSRYQWLNFTYSDPERNFNRNQVRGVAAVLFKVSDPKFFVALDTAGGGKMSSVVVNTSDVAGKLLKNGGLQRRTRFLPLDKMESRVITQHELKAARKVLGGGSETATHVHRAIDLIEFDEDLRPAMEHIFGNTLVCTDLETANKVAFNQNVRKVCVTLKGDKVDPGGMLSGGSLPTQGSTLMHVSEILKFKATQADKEVRMREMEDILRKNASTAKKYHQLNHHLETTRMELEKIQERLKHTEHHSLQEDYDSLKKMTEEEEASLAGAEKTVREGGKKVKDLEHKIKNAQQHKEKELKDADADVKKYKKALDASKAKWSEREAEEDRLKMEIEELRKTIDEADRQLKSCDDAFKVIEEKLLVDEKDLEESKTAAKNAKEAVKEQKDKMLKNNKEINVLQSKKETFAGEVKDKELIVKELEHKISKAIEDAHNAERTVKHMLKQFEWITVDQKFFGEPGSAYDFKATDPKDAAKRVQRLEENKEKLERTVNLRAMTMLDKAEVQFNDLMRKKQTVETDKAKIKKVIAELDRKKKEELRAAWDKVNKDFGSIFSTLLPGSKARLQPPEGMDVLDGLEVKVAFGDVWKESLNELSGGQRSLVALSLILSLLLFKPAPLYILDEVDAALDLSHTQNIGRMLKTHFKHSQFIVVSLKDGMFNNANVLFRTKFVDGMSTVSRTVNKVK